MIIIEERYNFMCHKFLDDIRFLSISLGLPFALDWNVFLIIYEFQYCILNTWHQKEQSHLIVHMLHWFTVVARIVNYISCILRFFILCLICQINSSFQFTFYSLHFKRFLIYWTRTHTHTHTHTHTYIYIYIGWLVGWLVEVYGISTDVGYLTPNPFLNK